MAIGDKTLFLASPWKCRHSPAKLILANANPVAIVTRENTTAVAVGRYGANCELA